MSIISRITNELAGMTGSREGRARRCAEMAVARHLQKFKVAYSHSSGGIYAEVYSAALRIQEGRAA